MPVKCSFCRQRFVRYGPYEKHLRIVHANLDIVLTSRTENLINDSERDINNTNDLIERPNSDYESEQGNHPAVYEGDGIPNMPTNNSNTEAPNEHTSEQAQQGHYTDTGEAIGDVQGYQEDNSYLC